MAIDLKYGLVTTERGSLGDAEPVVVFRAQDKFLPKVLAYYLAKCAEAGSPHEHSDAIIEALETVVSWQLTHTTKVPD